MSSTANIVGAGLSGLAAAVALSSIGVTCRVFEKADALGEVGAGIQLSPNAMLALRALGLEAKVLDAGFKPQAAVIRDGRTGKIYLSASLAAECRRRYGAPYIHIHRADLHAILLAAATKAGAVIETDAPVAGYDATGPRPTLRLENGVNVQADLLIGADGVRSTIRSQISPSETPEFTGQVAWRGLIPTKDLPPGLIPPDATVWAGPGKHFVTYYVRGGDLVNFVAVEERTDWRGESWTEPGDKSALSAAFDGWRSEVTELIDRVDQCFLWALFDRRPLSRWSDGNVALIGDACHPMPPFMAQGAAMAMEDAYVLAKCLDADSDTPRALRHYENLRKPRTTKVLNRARANADLFHMEGPGARARLLAASFVPRRFALTPFDWIYGFDPTAPPSGNSWSSSA